MLTVDKDELNRKASMVSDKLKHASSDRLECRGRSRTKSFEDYSQSHQRRLKRKRAAECELSLNWLHLEGFTPSKLEVLDNTTGEETIHLATDILGPHAHSATREGFELINMVLLINDKHSISGRAYHEMVCVKQCENITS